METLTIKKDDAIKAHENTNSKGKNLLEDLLGKKTFQQDVIERIKTFSDVLEELGIDAEKFDDVNEYLSLDEESYRRVKLICKALNEGWTPDWNNNNEYKYYPWFEMGSSGFRFGGYDYWVTDSYVGSRLCFKSRELAEYAGKQFEAIYENFMIIN